MDKVTAWGSDGWGVLDVPASLAGQFVTAVSISNSHALALTSDGRSLLGERRHRRHRWRVGTVPASLDGKQSDRNRGHGGYSAAVTADGELVVWGGTNPGRTDLSNVPESLTDKDVVAVAFGWQHALALTSDGKVTAWGQVFLR